MTLTKHIKILHILTLICLIGALPTLSLAGEYESLKGVDSIKAIFDFRDGIPESALVHLKLIHMTFQDKAITNITKKPQMVVVFMDKSVKLLSKDRKGFSAKENKMIDEMAKLVSAMTKDGIRLEVCLLAVNYFKVDPKSLLPELHHVDNGWISSIGYQTKGYTLVPAF